MDSDAVRDGVKKINACGLRRNSVLISQVKPVLYEIKNANRHNPSTVVIYGSFSEK
jgi:hypothetical protein